MIQRENCRGREKRMRQIRERERERQCRFTQHSYFHLQNKIIDRPAADFRRRKLFKLVCKHS